MPYLWLVLLILGAGGYLAYTKGYGKTQIDWVLNRGTSVSQVEKLEKKATMLEAEATKAEKLRDVKKRISVAQARINNARR